MAQVDSRIALGVQPVDVGAAIGRGYQLRDLAAQADARKLDTQLKQQAVQKQKTLGDLYRGALGPDGKIDRAKVTQGVVEAGYGADLPDMQKQWSDADKAEADYFSKNSETIVKQLDYTSKTIGALLQNPNTTAQDVARAVSGLTQFGLLKPEQGAEIVRSIPGDPVQLRQYLQGKLMESQQAKDMLTAALPSIKEINLGGHTQLVDTNPLTNPGIVGQSLEHTATPGEIEQQRHNRASEGLTARGQNMTDARARETKNAASLKPMPAAALKMIQTSTDAIGTAASINADLGAIAQQITSGKLSFGPISNLVNAARNATGTSTEESRNFASFKASLEKLRNDSLRLNAGVQTDGDAQRAWNELFQNITDTKLVEQRLQEIMRINQRAVQLRQLDIDSVLQNYGRDPMDTSGYANQPAALSSGSTQKPAPNQSQVNPSQGPVAIKTDADYNNLPSGTRFKAPDGSIRVKP
ncbi:MAG: hypothetical protein ACI4QS_10760 [Comamonas sp.]